MWRVFEAQPPIRSGERACRQRQGVSPREPYRSVTVCQQGTAAGERAEPLGRPVEVGFPSVAPTTPGMREKPPRPEESQFARQADCREGDVSETASEER